METLPKEKEKAQWKPLCQFVAERYVLAGLAKTNQIILSLDKT